MANGTQTRGLRLGSASMRMNQTPEVFGLWLLIALELGAMVALRQWFRRHHGG
jgi:hypothetical protein